MDGRTLAIATNVVGSGLTLLAILLWLSGKMFPGFGRWTLGRTLAAFATLIAIQSGIWPDWLATTTLAAVGLCDLILILEACREFLGIRVRVRWNYIALAGAFVVEVYIGVIHHSVREYFVAWNLVASVLYSACAWTLFRAPASRRQVGMLITGFSFSAGAVAYIARAGYYLVHPGGTLVQSDPANTAYLLFLIIWLIGTNFGFFLMNYERLLLDREQEAARTERARDELSRLKESLEETVATRTAQLTENERTLEEAQQMAHVGNYSIDELTNRVECSAELYRIYEFDPARIVVSRQTFRERAHPDDRAMIGLNLEDALQRRARLDFSHRLLMPDGRVKYVLVRGEVGTFADGRLRTSGTVQDITELKQAEQEKAKLQAELNQASKMESIGRLAGGVAHDFNNLLTVINGYSAMLSRQLDAPLRRYAEQINQAGASAASFTRQLLDFSRMEATDPGPVFLNDVVSESRDMLHRLAGAHIEMKTTLGASPDSIMADRNQIYQCLMNLVVNARDAMPDGGQLTVETDNVEVTPEDLPIGFNASPGPHVRLIVRDAGIGMDEETRSRIFEPFFTTKEKGSGTGLGLATVYGIVTRWRGFLKVRSKCGYGSEFSICLPLNAAAAPPPETPVAAETVVRRAAAEKILVVEDQDAVRGFVVETLRMDGYEVVEACNGADALQLIESDSGGIQLMMTDIVMPGVGGLELADRVSAVCPSLKVLFMTGYADASFGGVGLQFAGEVIMKPFTPEALCERVRGLLHPAGG